MDRDANDGVKGSKDNIEVALADERALSELALSPVPGMNLQQFRMFWMRAMSGDLTVPPALLFLTMQKGDDPKSAEKRGQQEWEAFFCQYAVILRLRELDELIQTKSAERDQLLADMRDDDLRLELFERHEKGQQRAKVYLDSHGSYELNETGELADEDAEDMLKTWERRTGKRLNRKNPDDVNEAFREQGRFEDGETVRTRRKLEAKRKHVTQIEEEIHQLESAREEGGAALRRGDDPKEIDADLQRELIAKGPGTEDQKQKLAEQQGISVSTASNVSRSADAFDDDSPSVKSAFNDRAGAQSTPVVDRTSGKGLPARENPSGPNV